MNEKIVASDTGPFISLERLDDGFNFFKKVYKEVIIPQGVYEELLKKEKACF